jgi:DNA segregation ATPase FtsK/SpoIIIE-like protein
MTFRGDDDYEYIDDDDYYPDDEDDDDEDEELGGDWRSRLGSRSSGLPGRDRSSGLGTSGSNSPFGSKSDSSPSSRSKSSPFSSGGNSPNRSSGSNFNSGGTRDKFNDRLKRSGDTGQLRSSSSSPSSPSSSGGKDWRSSLSGDKKPDSGNDKKSPFASDNKKSGGGFGNRFGGNKSNAPKDDKKSSGGRFGGNKSDAPKDDKKSSGGRFGGNKSNAPKDDKKDSGGGGGRFGGLSSRLGSKKDDAPKDDKKSSASRFGGSKSDASKDDKKDSGGGRFGGLSNRLGGKKDDAPKDDKKSSGGRFGGSKSDASKDDKKNSGGGGRFGGLSNRLGSNKGDAPKDNKKTSSAAAATAAGGVASRFGGIRNRIGGSAKEDDKKATGSDKKSGGFRSTTSSKQSGLGAKKATKDNKAGSEEKSGGRFSNIFNRGNSDESASKPAPKSRTSKAPKVEADDWFDLDRKLDLVGVGLVFGSILLFFSALSQEQAAISAVHNFISELFGWGAMAVPITMFAVGMWLIVRHFGDDAPTIDLVRLGGVVIGFIAVLALFQYIESFNYIEQLEQLNWTGAVTTEILEVFVTTSYQTGQGGGIIGGWLYLSLVNTITEIGGFVFVAMVLTFALMMVTHLSMAEIAVVFIGIGRSFRSSMAQNAAKRRAQRLKAEQQKALEAQATSVTVSTPAPAQLPGFSNAGALPEPSDDPNAPIPIEERDILIRRGGQAFSSTELEQPILLGNVPQPQYAEQPQKSGSRLGRLFGRNKPKQHPVQPQPLPTTAAVAATASAGLMGKLLNRNADPQPATQQPAQQPVVQPTTTPNPAYATNIPVGDAPVQQPVQPQQPIEQPVAQPQQQPAMAFNATAQTAQPTPPVSTPIPPPPQQPQQPPVAQPQQPIQQPQADPIAMRHDRLNAIRSGQTAPQQPVAQPQTPQPVARNGGGNGNDYNPFGRPDDIPTHDMENLPGQDFSTTRPISTDSQLAAVINPKKNDVQKPVSSGPVNQSKIQTEWKLPDYRTLLSSGSEQEFDREHLLNQARVVEETLASFGAPGRVVEVNTGPVITQFGVEPDYLTARSGKKSRVKVSAIAQLDKDMQLALGAKTIRVEAPVPGKGYVGIEVPNVQASLVSLRDVMESEGFQKIKTPLAIALGMSVDGTPISADLTSMPHLLIAGTTGSGKSVCVNAIINSIVATNTPDEVKFIMVDPKRVELTGYNGLPHLVAPVVVELERIIGVLKWVTREMDERYKKFSNAGARNIIDYNKHRDQNLEQMPYIVVIIDELADLMMLAPDETERTITRIAALARATGIHLVIATQRPSVDVVTGLIKANFPARIAFAVAGGVDSRVILDQPGAERLLGKGDMLYLSGDSPSALRLQGVFVSDMEIDNIGRFWKMQSAGVEPVKPISIMSPATPSTAVPSTHNAIPTATNGQTTQTAFWDESGASTLQPTDAQKLAVEDKTGNPDPQEDELYETAVQMVRRLDKASISLLQRRLRIGYTRAARLIDMMEERGVVGPSKEGSSKPRDVIPE